MEGDSPNTSGIYGGRRDEERVQRIFRAVKELCIIPHGEYRGGEK